MQCIDCMAHFKHRYTPNNRNAPLVDAYQNITDIEAEEETTDSGTYTTITFTRPICSNNEPNDIPLYENPFLLYAWGPVNNYDASDPDSIGAHVERGWSDMRMNFICDDGKVTTTTRIESTHQITTICCFRYCPSPHRAAAAVHVFMIIDIIHTCI